MSEGKNNPAKDVDKKGQEEQGKVGHGVTQSYFSAEVSINKNEQDHLSDLLKSDYAEVWNQIRHIQACRSNIFIATVAAVVAATGTFLSIAFSGLPEADRLSILIVGSLTIIIVLIVGLLSVVEKAKAINFRKGFLLTISRHYGSGTAPESYRGWAELQNAKIDCKVYRNEESPRCGLHNTKSYAGKEGQRPTKDCGLTCWSISEMEIGAAGGNEKSKSKIVLPDMTESFMALAGYIFLVMLVGAIIGMALGVYFKVRHYLGGVYEQFMFAAILCVVCLVGGIFPYMLHVHSVALKKIGRNHKFFLGFSYILVASAAFLLFLSFMFYAYEGGDLLSKSEFWRWFSYVILVSLAFFLAYCFVSGYAYLEKCRVGPHSRRVYGRAWENVLAECHPCKYGSGFIKLTTPKQDDSK